MGRRCESLYVLDVLPARSSLAAVLDPDVRRVRFQATDSAGRESEWTDWFPLDDLPVRLEWAAFTWPGGR